MSHEPPELRTEITLFVLVSVVLAVVFAVIEGCRYFLFGTKLWSMRDIAWMAGMYIAAWVLAGLTDRFRHSHRRMENMESRLIEIEKRLGISR
jgi:hypothetical protein